MDLADFELSQEDLQEIETLEFNALQTSFRDISSDDESENLHVPKKRRRMVINSDSESDSVKDFVLQNLPTSSNTYTKWKNPTGCTARVIPFTEPTGMKFPFSRDLSQGDPEDFYSLLVDDSLFEIIAEQSNLFATQSFGDKDFKPCSRSHTWQPTDKHEIKRFFGLILFMGLVKLPSISDYWSTDNIFQQPFPRTVMTRNRFELLLQYLHFADNYNLNPNDRIGKIRYLVNLLNDKFKAYYAPKEELCVDESMIPFRGRVTFRQYNKSKRHKYGIKLFKVCTNPGYTLKIQVYSGKNIDIENNTPTKIVLSLCDELLNKGHTIATDNWYTSLELAYELLKNDTHFLGTVRKNRKYLPRKVVETNLKRGEFVAQENDCGITVLKWKDKRDVLMLSTKHTHKFTRLNVRGKAVQKPAMVIDYNKCKASVDMSDQMTAYSTPLRKTVKWYRKLAIELLLNTAVVNALIMYKETTKKNISVVDYRKNLVQYLTKSGRPETGNLALELRPKRRKHELVKKEGPVRKMRRFCVGCYKNNVEKMSRKDAKNKTLKVPTYCLQCDGQPHYCLPCFNREHRT
ncbi:unnamed protein product [Parnassius apollo]|uniref:(apollo) hypothetical protein n=1 Tax=Parnassius apollo TaxID=110799 RepID=A0A8S3XDZ0_PARAO|nr:unnamed protein product [Parnassius apollo]